MKSIIVALLLSTQAFAADEWYCETQSGKRAGNTLWSCGIGSGLDESHAREDALKAAFREFDMICDSSADCAGKRKTVDPQRTSCKQDPRGFFSCVRLIVVTLEK